MRHSKGLILLVTVALLILPSFRFSVAAQPGNIAVPGHTITGNTVTFIFYEAYYELDEAVESVAVLGIFNDYDATRPEWQLTRKNGTRIWTLDVELGSQVKRGAPFIFVVNGEQVQPPSNVDPNYLLPDSWGGYLFVVGGLAELESQNEIISRLERQVYTNKDEFDLAYYQLTPEDYDPSEVYPLVIFLHGINDRGESMSPILPYNGAYEIIETAGERAYFMLVPQLDRRSWGISPVKKALLGLIAETQEQFSIDPDRIYITGLSLGALGVWSTVHGAPDLFAAGISVCGGDELRNDLAKMTEIAHIPFQVFHGSDDSIVSVNWSRRTVRNLEAAGADVIYTEYEGEDHWVWVKTFTNPDVIDWLFAQSKP